MDHHVDPTWIVYLQITPFLSQTYPSLHFVPPGLAWRGSAGAGPAVASDEAAREASESRDGARMGRVGVWRASPAGRRAGNGGEEAAQRRTVVVGRALTPGALHDKAKGWVRAQTGRGERGGAVGVRN